MVEITNGIVAALDGTSHDSPGSIFDILELGERRVVDLFGLIGPSAPILVRASTAMPNAATFVFDTAALSAQTLLNGHARSGSRVTGFDGLLFFGDGQDIVEPHFFAHLTQHSTSGGD